MYGTDRGRCPVIPSQLNAQSQQFTIPSLVDYFWLYWFPQDLFPVSLSTFFKLKVLWRQFPATSDSLITFSGPCSLRTTTPTESVSNGESIGLNYREKKKTNSSGTFYMKCFFFILMVLKVVVDHHVSHPLSPVFNKSLRRCMCWMRWISKTWRVYFRFTVEL